MVHGIGKTFWHFLLVMLYMTFRENQEMKSEASLAVSNHFWGIEILPAGHSARVHSSIASSSMQAAAAAGAASAASWSTGLEKRATVAALAGRSAGRTPATGDAIRVRAIRGVPE